MERKYGVISYYVGEFCETFSDSELWVFDSYNEAQDAFKSLVSESTKFALEDENYQETEINDDCAIVSWDDLKRVFEILPVNGKSNVSLFHFAEALFRSEWEDGSIIETPCKVNLDTLEVFDIVQVDVEIDDVCCGEYVELNGEEHEVFEKDDARDGEFWIDR